MTTQAIEAGARAAARVNGDDYDAIPADKPEWIRESGQFGGRFRDINEPFKSGYEEMAEVVITAYREYLAAEGFVVVPKEPTEAMLKAGHAGEYNRPVGRYANIYHAMLAAAAQEPFNASEDGPAMSRGPA